MEDLRRLIMVLSTTLPCPRLGACSAIAWLGGLLAQKAHVCWGWEQTWRSSVRGRLRSLRRRGERVAQAGRLPVREGSSPSWRHAMWTTESRALVGDFGAGQALSDEQYALLAPLIPPAKPGGRPRTADVRRMLDGLSYLVRTGCQWRHLPPPPAFPPW